MTDSGSGRDLPPLTPALMLSAYAAGLFPMASHEDPEELDWYDPDPRGVIPLDDFHLPRRLRRTVLSGRFRVTADTAFRDVMLGCAAPAPGRESTWINTEIIRLFTELHEKGFGHSIEVWKDDELAGGLYGVALGGAFFGESMFSRTTDASRTALVHLTARLRLCGFILLDTQFGTEHLSRFGGVEIPRSHYKAMLEKAVNMPCCWRDMEEEADLILTEIRSMRAGDREADG
ncbi:leucyl/phenylalanyl-tRNA--protein transferase [Acetobacter sp. AN02]|uniref:leucyl/phenylalanyl-tRNA--protein transferase n=1 Tax=Acetobacter sp. AN02 TaxID=2894186 RepID=UPI0024345300|nr:leucyl/phenylalanyl-tRNA--protein transferase [Acetobacter sp. AN02]MDG6094978.1 leucyl/phenylalanyl-tRNA--protein transferase [Acetobacter sp. AN02]